MCYMCPNKLPVHLDRRGSQTCIMTQETSACIIMGRSTDNNQLFSSIETFDFSN